MCVCQSGGVYMFCNGVGCDGERVYWDGGSMIAVNGSIVSRGAQFSMNEVVSSINYQNYQLFFFAFKKNHFHYFFIYLWYFVNRTYF